MGRLKQSVVALVGRAIPAAVGLGAVATYTRLLDPASFGSYALLLSASMLASAVGFAWLRNASLRVVAGEPQTELRPDVAATIAAAFVVTAVVVGIVEAIVLHAFRPGLSPTTIALAVAAAWVMGWYDLSQALMQARLRLVEWGALNLTRALAAFVVTLVCIRLDLRANALLIGFIAGNATALCFPKAWLAIRSGRFNPALFVRLFRFGWPLSAKAGLEQLAPTVQRYLVNFVAGTGVVGIFVVANDFTAQTLNAVLGSINLAGATLAFRARDVGGEAALARQLNENARIIFAIASPLALGVAALAVPIASVVFGPRFQDGAAAVIVVIGISSMIGYMRVYYFDLSFELAMKTGLQPIISLVGTAVMIGASLLLVPRYGALGAALAALAATFAALVLSIVWGRRLIALPVPFASWLKSGVATAAMLTVLAAFPKHGGVVELLSLGTLGAATYVAASAALRFERVRLLVRTRLRGGPVATPSSSRSGI